MLSGETISSWITVSSNGQVTWIRRKLLRLWQIWQRLMIQQERCVPLQVSGAEYQLTGPYGWKIDQAGEIAALTELIRAALYGRMVTAQTESLFTARVQLPEQAVTGEILMCR